MRFNIITVGQIAFILLVLFSLIVNFSKRVDKFQLAFIAKHKIIAGFIIACWVLLSLIGLIGTTIYL